jgi:hypothetical protein
MPKKNRAHFPDHRDRPLSKVEKVKTKNYGTFEVLVFKTGKNWRGNPAYEVEIQYPDPEQYSTSSKTLDSVPEAVAHGKKMIAEAVTDVEKAEREARKTPKQKDLEKLGKKLAFFREQGADVAQSKKLLKAEEIAEERGWKTEWNQEQGDWSDYLGEGDSLDDIDSVEYVVLKDEEGSVLESLGGITFAKRSSTRANQDYGRLLEAELAVEAASKLGLL